MSWFRSAPHRALLSIAVLYAAMIAVVFGMRQLGFHPNLPVRLAIAIPVAGAAFWFVAQYWRALDEVAREAHKWSWYWGGTAGMMLAFVLLMVRQIGLVDWLAAGAESPQHLLMHGGLVVIACQLLGATVAWLLWWARRR